MSFLEGFFKEGSAKEWQKRYRFKFQRQFDSPNMAGMADSCPQVTFEGLKYKLPNGFVIGVALLLQT